MSSSEEDILKPCLPVGDIDMEENDKNPNASTSSAYLKFVQYVTDNEITFFFSNWVKFQGRKKKMSEGSCS